MRASRFAALLVLATIFASRPAAAQVVGTFRWQMEPWCNLVTLRVEQVGPTYRLDGTDDQCGAGPATVTGSGQMTGPSTVVLGFSIVTAPSGRPVHVSATLSLPGGSGTWQDSTNETGTFSMVAVGAIGGTPRPLPSTAFTYGMMVTQRVGDGDRGVDATVLTDTGTPGDAAAVFGQFGLGATFSTPSGNAGVHGDSRHGIGVIGTSNTGTGVFGRAEHIGVEGRALDGTGVLAASDTGTTALELQNGSIRVSGALRPAFVHTTTVANTSGHLTTLNAAGLNGLPTAMVLVTHVFQSATPAYVMDPVGVWYDTSISRWRIFVESGAPMPVGATFNVFVILQ